MEAKVPEIANDPDMKVSRAALKSLKDVGYSEEELAAAWNGAPFSMRDHRAQLLDLEGSAIRHGKGWHRKAQNPNRFLQCNAPA